MSAYFTLSERYKLETMLQDKIPVKDIAVRLGKHFTTVYREIKRGTVLLRNGATWENVPTYCADVAQRKQDEKSHNKGVDLKIGTDICTMQYMEQLIKDCRYSAYAVSIALKAGHKSTVLCPQTIYNYINNGVFLNVDRKDLIYNKVHRKEEKPQRRPSLKMLGAKTIEERPKEISKRNTFGHWEMDTVYSGKGKSKDCLLVLTERLTRHEIVRKIPDRTAQSVVNAVDTIEKKIGTKRFTSLFKTITCDNGVEFTKYKELEISCKTGMRRTFVYFCHAFCSSERGSNENANKLIRKYIPKSADIGQYTLAQIADIERSINNYPRKLFGGLSSVQYAQTLGL